jgi:hypothetical protein
MRFGKAWVWAVAAGAMLLSTTAARADTVTYITSGVFDSGDTAGTGQYTDTAHGVTISFLSSGTQVADTTFGPTLATFGSFDTSLTTGTTNSPILGHFTLSIFQIGPVAGGPIDFVGAMSGVVRVSSSSAYIEFAAPLTQTIGDVFYQIVSADSSHAGRVNLSPPTLNNGLSTIAGRVGSVPEPSALVLMGIGAPALLAIRYRKKQGIKAAA